MNCKVVAVFRDRDAAQRARADLIGSGSLPEEIDLHEQAGAKEGDRSLWEKIKDFFTPEEEGMYREAGRRGGILLAVHTQESRAHKIQQLLERHHPLNLESSMEDWRKEGARGGFGAGRKEERTPAAEQSTPVSEQRIPVTEEQIKVGKRVVDTGGVRIHKRVEETPVNETIALREERVTVERRPAGGRAEKIDMEEGTVEVRGSREEAVVSKEPRVIEEVVIRKEAIDRQGRVSDKVRRTRVDVEENEEDYRTDFNQHYATSGGRFEEYLPAYSFGRKAAMDERYQGRDWQTIEPEIEREYLGLYPEKWSQHRQAVRYGYDRAFAESGREAR